MGRQNHRMLPFVSRCFVRSQRSMVWPVLSTERSTYRHSPLTRLAVSSICQLSHTAHVRRCNASSSGGLSVEVPRWAVA